MRETYIVLTNNPLAAKKLEARGAENLLYRSVTYRALLEEARDLIHQGRVLLSHPLAGSVKPGETPYRSLLLSKKPGNRVDEESLWLIEQAISACGKFADKTTSYSPAMLTDFQLVDWSLLESALASAVR